MSDSWLDSGHGDGLSLAPVRSLHTPEAGPTEGPASGVWRSRSGRTIVAVVAVAAMIGSAGTAYAIRETLFPNIGAPTARSVWQNPVPVDEPTPVAVTSPTTSSTTSSTSTTSTTSTSTVLSTNTPTVSNVPTLAVPSNRDDSDDPPSVSDDATSSRTGPGTGSDDPETDVADTPDSDTVDSESVSDNSGSGSGADDPSDADLSESDDDFDDGVDDVDELDD